MSDPMTAYITQAWSLQGQLPLLIVIAALLGLGKGGVPGFATVATAATVATSPTNISGGLGLAVALQVPILTMIDISAAWLHKKDLDWDTIKLLLPLSFVGMGIGQYLDKLLSDAAARLLVGVLLLMILMVQLGKDSIMSFVSGTSTMPSSKLPPSSEEEEADLLRLESGTISGRKDAGRLRRRSSSDDKGLMVMHHDSTSSASTTTISPSKGRVSLSSRPELSRNAQFVWACIVGIVGGAATMLTNAMGPILNVYLLSVVQLSPTAYIGTRAMFFCFLNVGKIPMRFMAGTLGWSMLPLAGFLGIFSVLGVFGAKPIMLSMKEENFVKLELAVVAFSGLRLCYMGLYP
ncbi:sulfite exporter TauE/SafE [Nitzschia inconspicua]|uniref:Sulfite exporter TauE/SafE n=1 Tax=Nitzschia inconspicua TaxID=303405 RepID=A0A9K3KUT9_9STRA|nr:sulfite exporter TauE/SafE [Nitzschia inconspicua]